MGDDAPGFPAADGDVGCEAMYMSISPPSRTELSITRVSLAEGEAIRTRRNWKEDAALLAPREAPEGVLGAPTHAGKAAASSVGSFIIEGRRRGTIGRVEDALLPWPLRKNERKHCISTHTTHCGRHGTEVAQGARGQAPPGSAST